MTSAISGTFDPGYESVVAAFERSDPKPPIPAVPSSQSTATGARSSTSGRDPPRPSATCAKLLIQRGLLDPAAPVAKYWPEFAAQGKEHITVTHVLSHQAGLAVFPESLGATVEDTYNPAYAIPDLEKMAPLWEPGTAFFYHPLNYGHLVGEIVHRITGKTIGQFFHEEIATPHGLDLWIGLPADKEARVVPHILPSSIWPRVIYADTPEARAREKPAAGGVGNARSLAKMYAAILGVVHGVGPILSPETIARARASQTDGLSDDPPPFPHLHFPRRFGLGYELSRGGNPILGAGVFWTIWPWWEACVRSSRVGHWCRLRV